MTNKYRGKNTLALIKPKNNNERIIYAQTSPNQINFIFKIVKTYSHLAIPVQIDPQIGIIAFHTTSSLESELQAVLASIPRPLTILT